MQKKFSTLLLLWLVIVCGTTAESSAKTSTNEKPAKVKVSGFGWLENREMHRLLKNFQVDGEMPPVIDRTFVEDAALILLARAQSEGYLNATVRARFTMADDSTQEFTWTNVLETLLPRDFAATRAHFQLRSGVRFYYDSITFTGNQAISEREARQYFIAGDVLLKLRGNRIFSPDALKTSLAALQEAYARKGFQSAVIRTNTLELDNETGAVVAAFEIDEGPQSIVREVNVQVGVNEEKLAIELNPLHPDAPYSRLWEEELAEQLRSEQFAKGYPDTQVKLTETARQTNANHIQLDFLAEVITGPLIRVGDILAEGNRRTKTSVLTSRVNLEEGEPLNRIEAEKSRQRLARLGAFDSVRLRYDDRDATTRDVTYLFDEGKPLSLSLLAGFGSYELLRGGLEFQHRNLFGRAHNLRLRGMQSFKATRGDLLYTVPEVFGENVTLFTQGSGLRREEPSFTREEFGGSAGVSKRLAPIQTDLTVRYDYEFLTALDVDSDSTNRVGVVEARSAAFVIELNRDRRDNPLLPRRGLKLHTRLEFATAGLGGNVDYQRLVFGGSYHVDLRGGRLLHFGLVHGMSFTLGGSQDELPFNKRFFPGGESSVRGFQEGKASPLDDDGEQLGAETFTQANFEFEQLLTRSWSLVVFCDAVGFARERGDYPADEILYSVGGGIRWRSIIGPVRLEYGFNPRRRDHDPSGTLHFSVGFPF